MYYVMSDIHGEYDKYMEMLAKIHFSVNDTLIVLGDVVDRGPEPIKVLKDMMLRENVYPLMGNHEIMALDILKTLLVEITEDNYDSGITDDDIRKLMEWQLNGGDVTMEKFKNVSVSERESLIEYMEEFENYMTLEVDGKKFLLVHAGLGNYEKGKMLDDYTLAELTFSRPMLDTVYYSNKLTVVVGHTPTQNFIEKSEIFTSGNVKFIDCGAAYGGRLACLCLDTMEEFYV